MGARSPRWARWALGGIALGFVACGDAPPKRVPWFTRVAGKTVAIGAFSVVSQTGLPEVDERDLSAIVSSAREANPGARVRTLTWTRTHPLSLPVVIVGFAPHHVSERVRLYRAVEFVRRGRDVDGRATGPWRKGDSLGLCAQVCAPGRSFLEGPEISTDQCLDLSVDAGLTPEDLVRLVDDVAAHVPEGELPVGVRKEGGGYEMRTVDAEDATYGSTLSLGRGEGGWLVLGIGRWIS